MGERVVVLGECGLGCPVLLDFREQRLEMLLCDPELGFLGFARGALAFERLRQPRDRRPLVLEVALRLYQIEPQRLLALRLVGERIRDASEVAAKLRQRLVDPRIAAFAAVGPAKRVDAFAQRGLVSVAHTVRVRVLC